MERIFVGTYVPRDAAVLAGKDRFGWSYLEIDPSKLTEVQRQTLVQMPLEKKQTNKTQEFYNLDVDEACRKPRSAFYGYRLRDVHLSQPVLTSLTQKDFIEFLAFAAEALEKSTQFRKNEIKDWLANGDLTNHQTKYDTDPEFAEAVSEKLAKLERERAEHLEAMRQKEREQDEAARQRRAERVAQDEALKQKKHDQLVRWVMRYGTETEKKMLERDMLKPDSVLARVRDDIFQGFSDLERFKKIKDSDIAALVESDYSDSDIEYSARDFDGVLEPEQFELLEQIEQAASEIKADRVSVTARWHLGGYKSHQDWDVKQLTAHVSVEIGGWELSREFALGGLIVLD